MTRQEAIEIVSRPGRSLKDLDEKWRNDKAVVMQAVKNDGYALYHASEELKGNKRLALASVRRKGRMLRHLTAAMQDDRDVVLAAVRNDPGALRYASLRCRGDKSVALHAVGRSGDSLKFCSDELRNDKEVALASFKGEDVSALKHLPMALLNDRDVVMKAVNTHFTAWNHLAPEWRTDPGILSTLTPFRVVRDEATGEPMYYEDSRLGIRVALQDLGRLDWDSAMEACAAMGEGWLLPDLDTLKLIRRLLYLKGLGDFSGDYYWSSKELGRRSAKYLRFSDGVSENFYCPEDYRKHNPFLVRAVMFTRSRRK